MTITPKGQWNGDPRRFCERLTLTGRTQQEAAKIALVYRVLSDPDQRDRLLDLAERIEEESSEGAQLVGS